MRKILLSVGIIAVTIVLIGLGSKLGRGTIGLQVVPAQVGAPLIIESVTWKREALSQPVVRVRNEASHVVNSAVAALVVSKPDGELVVGIPLRIQPMSPREASDVIADIGQAWSADPWGAYPRGAMMTLGLASAQFADGSEWYIDVMTSKRFTALLTKEDRPSATALIGRVPPWITGSNPALTNGPVQYATNGSLDNDACVVSYCRSGYCEFNGCVVRP